MLEQLKNQVFLANKKLVENNLVALTWGNASAFDPESNYLVIKPSGVDYSIMSAEDMVVVDLEGNVIEGKYNPSSDTHTHIAIYKYWGSLGVLGVVHTHSLYATSWAQSGMDLPVLGTTHADYFYGDIPCLSILTSDKVSDAYEHHTGMQIVSEFEKNSIHPIKMCACLLHGHGPFTWGENVDKAVENSIVLEIIAHMGLNTVQINNTTKLPQYILDKHYLRKNGANAYYGQKKT